MGSFFSSSQHFSVKGVVKDVCEGFSDKNNPLDIWGVSNEFRPLNTDFGFYNYIAVAIGDGFWRYTKYILSLQEKGEIKRENTVEKVADSNSISHFLLH